MIDIIINILDYITHNIYSIFFVFVLIGSGLISFIFDTDHNYLFGHDKDYIISFFFSIFNIGLGVLLIIIKIIHSRFSF